MSETPYWQEDTLETPSGKIPVVATRMTFRDRLGHWKVRWGIGRNRLRCPPGVYAVGSPDQESPVIVTANYKMSFDRVRVQMKDRNAWILVLDTKGINVWCAAGKGTFGTEELLSRIKSTRLYELAIHRKLIVPQLGATGVNGREVKKRSGWRVIWGPVHVRDLPAFLDAGMKRTESMRRVSFPIADRVVLIPVELVGSAKYLVIAAVLLLLLSGLGEGGYSVNRVLTTGKWSLLPLVMAYLAGGALAPALLPWLPGRAFSLKGVWAGLIAVLFLFAIDPTGAGLSTNLAAPGGWVLIMLAISSFMAMNFTGASTYTSLSGVKKEMRVAVPMQIAFIVVGVVSLIVGRFI